jgi:hypothetical protein
VLKKASRGDTAAPALLAVNSAAPPYYNEKKTNVFKVEILARFSLQQERPSERR